MDVVSESRIRQQLLPFGESVLDVAQAITEGRDSRKQSALREALAHGLDPLGDLYLAAQSAEVRRKNGAVYTPQRIVESMIAWASRYGKPDRIVDPGAGSGRFLLAAAAVFPDADLVAVEKDPIAADILRANFQAAGHFRRVSVCLSDYRSIELPPHNGRTLFIGNPPYTRHHDIEPSWKEWYARTCSEWGIKASKLAGLHLHFFARTLQVAREGDFGVFITAAEWLDVNYGSALRELLVGRLGGLSLHLFDPTACPFPDAAATGAIACFEVGTASKIYRVQLVRKPDELDGLANGEPIPRERVSVESRWSTLIKSSLKPPSDYVELGELCRVHRGQVTGDNSVWIAGPNTPKLPEDLLVPAITKARELAGVTNLADSAVLRRVISLPTELDEIDPERDQLLKQFVAWAKSKGADKTYTALHRRAWWQVRLGEAAPILCSYMARRPPSFVRNLCGARHINVAHGIYPMVHMSDKAIDALTRFLRENVSVQSGRTYAGGLTKFEPKELERVHVPSLDILEA